mmetsp:Transcript_35147/g.81270  ORF Transcript_35147/g.81270 Transcript_35147/m.81270 type:complete len:370 (-) Transcript_35147:583-1692(-)
MDDTNSIRRNLIERIYLMNQDQRNEDIYHDNILATLAHSNLTDPSSLELSRRNELIQRLNNMPNLMQQSSRQAIFDNMSVPPSSRTISQDPFPSFFLEPSESAVSAESTNVPEPARDAVREVVGSYNVVEVGQDFPSKLHEILSNIEFEEIISWMPHGRSWKVHKPDEFVEKVAPQYFNQGKFGSFSRQVNRWGFRRITHGIDRNAYYHEYFLRGLPQLCKKIKRPGPSKTSLAANNDPDFYSDSISNPPLPPEALHGEFGSHSTSFQGLGLGIQPSTSYQSMPAVSSPNMLGHDRVNLATATSLLSRQPDLLQGLDLSQSIPSNLSLGNTNITTQNLSNENIILLSRYINQLQSLANHDVNSIVPSFR